MLGNPPHPLREEPSLAPCARERNHKNVKENRMTTKRDLLINQEYDYKQNWTTRGPMKAEL